MIRSADREVLKPEAVVERVLPPCADSGKADTGEATKKLTRQEWLFDSGLVKAPTYREQRRTARLIAAGSN